MMISYRIVFSTKKRTRIKLSFKVTPDIREYIESIAIKKDTIQKVHFYNDNKHIAIYQNVQNSN